MTNNGKAAMGVAARTQGTSGGSRILAHPNEAAPAPIAFVPAVVPEGNPGLAAIKATAAAGIASSIEALPVRIAQAGYVLADATRTSDLRQHELDFLMARLRVDLRTHSVVPIGAGRDGGTLAAKTDQAMLDPEYRQARERYRQAALARDNAGAVLEALRLRAAILLATERNERED